MSVAREKHERIIAEAYLPLYVYSTTITKSLGVFDYTSDKAPGSTNLAKRSVPDSEDWVVDEVESQILEPHLHAAGSQPFVKWPDLLRTEFRLWNFNRDAPMILLPLASFVDRRLALPRPVVLRSGEGFKGALESPASVAVVTFSLPCLRLFLIGGKADAR